MAKQTKITPDEISGRDELASVLAESLNKKFKDFKAAHFLDGREDTPTDLTEWISSGSTLLDLAISNRPNGGFPVGRIVELQGMEASGKSLIVAHTLANTQKKGGLAVYIDTENALSEEFLRAVGVDVSNMLYVPLETIEDAFEAIENIIETIRKSSKNRLVTIALDSVSAATTKIEQDADYEKDGWATAKAIVMSKAMRKITSIIGKQRVLLLCTSQLREKMGVMFGDKYCVDPFTTKVKIRYKKDEYVYEELTLDEFSKKFANSPDFDEPSVTDLSGEGVQVCTLDENGNEIYKDILSFVVKPTVKYHYTDGVIKITEDHVFVENGLEIKAQHHKDFIRVEEPMKVVDIEVEDLHTYLANGRLNHNTTSGGKALGFHASCRIRLKGVGKLKNGSGKTEHVVGVQTEAQVIKNRMGPPFKKAVFDIYFSSGIDDYNSWLSLMKDYGIVKQGGAYYTLVNEETGEEIRFMARDWRSMLAEDVDLKDYCYRKICDIFIMKYKAEDHINPDEVSVDDGEGLE